MKLAQSGKKKLWGGELLVCGEEGMFWFGPMKKL